MGTNKQVDLYALYEMSINLYPKQFVWVFSYEYIIFMQRWLEILHPQWHQDGLNNGVPPTYHNPLSHSNLCRTSSQGAECSYFSDAGPWT